ncbi:hypothetical protein [Nocardia pseudobrasiliensis]|uniref:Uncharacterized protein n=1 Tax=Nocardia pseudobrasiliensis TaxID=45979 RepID=A0A370IAY4_9NOCA|nr:hypothetical protein [Nocardia pseudobrasiliensis]RDI67885.1 hypothetical protein DFR76_102285 [Nocardia pseudobrasiliensis]
MPIDGSAADYSWELRHDDRVVESGALSWEDAHPWTGKAATDVYEMSSELFDLACSTALEDCRDAVVDARMEGRPDPVPIDRLAVILRDADGGELIAMTAKLIHLPITDAYVEEQIALLRATEEEDRRLALARQQNLEQPHLSALLNYPLEPPLPPLEPPEPPPAPDPQSQRVDDLERAAEDLRESAVDPDHCRRKLFEAEHRLADAEQQQRQLIHLGDEIALEAAAGHVTRCAEQVSFWHDRSSEVTEIYLRAAALDAEANRLRRSN